MEDLSNKGEPRFKRSSTKSGDPNCAWLLDSTGDPKVVASITGREDMEPERDRPRAGTGRPGLAKACEDGNSSDRRRSKRDKARSSLPRLRAKIDGPRCARSGIKGGKLILARFRSESGSSK